MHTITSMALFCDFENIALGVRDAKYAKFDIDRVLERLLLKGSIVVKKAYCDWDRYKEFKAPMHEASFELIEIPHVRMSGKNSADIRMVVDALDLCYTKAHVDTFVIISGDSDFSPLVSKLRENNKTVIGVGVKSSTSDLLIANCDEFIYYDDLVRAGRRRSSSARAASRRRSSGRRQRRAEAAAEGREDRGRSQAGSVRPGARHHRGAGRRARPGRKDLGLDGQADAEAPQSRFNECYYGFRTFSDLLEEAQSRKLLTLEPDQKSGGYIIRRVAHVIVGRIGAAARRSAISGR